MVRRLAITSVLLLLIMPVAWYELIHPQQFIDTLRTAELDFELARNAHERLRGIPFYASKADKLFAGFYGRRAARAERSELLEEAILWRLKALKYAPEDTLTRHRAGNIAGTTFAPLVRSVVPEYPTTSRSPSVVASTESTDGTVVWVTKSLPIEGTVRLNLHRLRNESSDIATQSIGVADTHTDVALSPVVHCSRL